MTTQPKKNTEDDSKDQLTSSRIVEMALEMYDTVKSTEGRLLAVPKHGGTAEEIKSLTPVLSAYLYTSAGISVGNQTIKTALDTLEGLTMQRAEQTVALRSAVTTSVISKIYDRNGSSETFSVPTCVYIDLGSHDSEVVRVNEYGWSLLSDERKIASDSNQEYPAAPLFRRTATIRPLPVPVRSTNGRDHLASILGLTPTDPKFLLVWGWLVASVFVNIPRPALWLTGQQGSGKTTLGLLALSVVNPTERMGGNFGKNERDDLTLLSGSFLPSFDNISNVSQSVNDFICRMVTGAQTSNRALYTNDSLHLSTIMRTAVFSSINLPIGLREDGLERIVHVHSERIESKSRLRDSDMQQKFSSLHPEILGCLLSDIAGVIANYSDAVKAVSGNLPRMADYATLLAALDLHLDDEDEELPPQFLQSYLDILQDSMRERALDDPFTTAILRLASDGGYKGTIQKLLLMLENAPERPSDHKAFWPSSARNLGNTLTLHAESLRAVGVTVERLGRQKDGQHIELTHDASVQGVPALVQQDPPIVLTTGTVNTFSLEEVTL
jgi:hypothetical protein